MCLSLLVFTQLFSEVARSQPAIPARKQNLTRNSQSGSFKVTHFGITEKPTDCISLYNTLASSLKYRKNSHRKRKKMLLSTTPLSFDALPRGTSTNIRTNLTPPELESSAYIFAADSMGVSAFKFLWWAPKDASFLRQSAYRPFNVIHGH